MNTLDTVVLEIIKRTQAAGGNAWMDENAPTETKLAFLKSLALNLGLHFS